MAEQLKTKGKSEKEHVPPESQQGKSRRRSLYSDGLNFSDPMTRDEHIQAFLKWLPGVLQHVPDIDWARLPSRVMAYCIRTVADSPDAIPIALAVGCAMNAVRQNTLTNYCTGLATLLKQFRAIHELQELSQLGSREFWEHFVQEHPPSTGEVRFLMIYDTLASIHERTYFEKLDTRQCVLLEPYALPPLPTRFLRQFGLVRASKVTMAKRRKEASDVLVPLLPVLVELAQLRKQEAERLIITFRKVRNQAIAGEIKLPYHFELIDRRFALSEDASTVASVQLIERRVVLSLILWDRISWVENHPDRYQSSGVLYEIQHRRRAYSPERNKMFLQYEGPPEDLLWCGNLIANRELGMTYPLSKMSKEDSHTLPKQSRFAVTRPGLLSPDVYDGQWFRNATRFGEILFDVESLYRGVLYAAALATLSLTTGARVNELLQVSASRFETVLVDELNNQEPTGRKIGILVQKLLPKGYSQETERQFFLISEMAGKLLSEIGQVLEATHGGQIPVVHPTPNAKAEDLSPEPYLFQSGASDGGRMGLLSSQDVTALLRFLFYGLALTTRGGKPIQIAPHLIRHVVATHSRQVNNVPAEAVAYLLHHRVTYSDSSPAPSLPEATAYYSRMPTHQLLALLFEAQTHISKGFTHSYLRVPQLRDLAQMDEELRRVFEQWSLIGPTVLGYCGAGLCIRPDNRAICLGCQFLVPHYSNIPHARTWRKLYHLQQQIHEAHGHHIDAQQAQCMVQYLDDVINTMQIQIRARQDGGYLPFADTLLPSASEEGDA